MNRNQVHFRTVLLNLGSFKVVGGLGELKLKAAKIE